MAARLLLVMCLLIPCLLGAGADTWFVREGRGYGPVELGLNLREAERHLGPPSASNPNPSSNSKFNVYPKGVSLLVNSDGRVIGITVSAAGARTASGLAIGNSLGQVQSKLGQGLRRGPDQYAFPQTGLGVGMSGGKVAQFFVFKPEQSLPLQGDRLTVPGVRCGDLKLGMEVAAVEKAWGSCPDVQGKHYRWADKGVGLLVESGRVQAITVTTGDYVTTQGLKVGSSRAEVLAGMGAPGSQQGGNLLYTARGIVFYLTDGQVSTVQVFAPMR